MSAKTFEQEFQERVAALEKEALEIGETWSSICRATGISRATPDRWRAATPNTVLLLDRMAQYVAKKRAELVAQALVSPKT
jgi:transposase-like protein